MYSFNLFTNQIFPLNLIKSVVIIPIKHYSLAAHVRTPHELFTTKVEHAYYSSNNNNNNSNNNNNNNNNNNINNNNNNINNNNINNNNSLV